MNAYADVGTIEVKRAVAVEVERNDWSGAIIHSVVPLLLCGARSGGIRVYE